MFEEDTLIPEPGIVLAIDPGNVQSAVVVWDGKTILDKQLVPNDDVCRLLEPENLDLLSVRGVYIEMVASYGMAVGKTVFETVLWIGVFNEIATQSGRAPSLVYRRHIKLHHCGQAKAKDSNIRCALIDKYGAPGTKKNPGVTYKIAKDLWAAFALATYVVEAAEQGLKIHRGVLYSVALETGKPEHSS